MVLFNCSQPEVMVAALIEARAVIENLDHPVELGVYANAFPPVSAKAKTNSDLLDIRRDLGPESYLDWSPSCICTCSIKKVRRPRMSDCPGGALSEQATFGVGCFWGGEGASLIPGIARCTQHPRRVRAVKPAALPCSI